MRDFAIVRQTGDPQFLFDKPGIGGADGKHDSINGGILRCQSCGQGGNKALTGYAIGGAPAQRQPAGILSFVWRRFPVRVSSCSLGFPPIS